MKVTLQDWHKDLQLDFYFYLMVFDENKQKEKLLIVQNGQHLTLLGKNNQYIISHYIRRFWLHNLLQIIIENMFWSIQFLSD